SCLSLNFRRFFPSTWMEPAEGRSRPAMIFKRVDFPLPLLPIIAVSSPFCIVRSSPCSATTSVSFVLYILTRLSHKIIGTSSCDINYHPVFKRIYSVGYSHHTRIMRTHYNRYALTDNQIFE